MEKMKKKKMKKFDLKHSFQTKTFRYGSFSIILSVIVIAIVVVLNLAVRSLPEDVIRKDLSQNQLFSLSDQTEELVKNLSQDVEIYVLSTEDGADVTLKSALERYQDLSGHISVTYIDPVLSPNFSQQYGVDSAEEGSVILVSGTRNKYIALSDIYTTSFDQNTYQYTQDFNGEQEITSGIDYVTTEELPVLYAINGHEEMEVTTSVQTQIEAQNVELKDLNLLTEGQIPEDASGLLIYAPSADYSADEAQMVIDYLENGGTALIMTTYTENEMPNFNSILENYGLELTQGLVLEGDSNYFYGNVLTLLPEIGSHEIIDNLSSQRPIAMMVNCQGIKAIEGMRSTITQTSLLDTSDSAFAKVPVDGQLSSAEKEEGDEEGPFSLGMVVTEETDNGTTKLVVFSSPYLLNEDITNNYNVVNTSLFDSSLSYLCGKESNISIAAKSTTMAYNTIPSSEITVWTALWVIIIPLVFLGGGFGIWMWRRKK